MELLVIKYAAYRIQAILKIEWKLIKLWNFVCCENFFWEDILSLSFAQNIDWTLDGIPGPPGMDAIHAGKPGLIGVIG